MDALARARLSLQGLSIGDAFGETFFTRRSIVEERLRTRSAPPGPWPWTDDTAMAISIVEELAANGGIDPDSLARRFADRYLREPARGYGGGAHRLLSALAQGESWRTAAPALFGGSGSFGNGAAMRVAPVGAYFADDPAAAAAHAGRSAAVTHSHPEGIAGAVAVAVAAAWMWRARAEPWDADAFLAHVVELTPASETRDGIKRAAALPPGAHVLDAVHALGNGSAVSAQDTVPFALWCASRHPDSFEDSLWLTAAGAGDVDTTCAIVGGNRGAQDGDGWRASGVAATARAAPSRDVTRGATLR